MRTFARFSFLLLCLHGLLLPFAFGQYSLLHTFQHLPADGNSPAGSLVSDGTYLYGMASSGGAFNSGIVFRLLPDGTGYTILHHFHPITNADGRSPFGSLTYDGTWLYGMTYNGGSDDNGTIFKMHPDSSGYTILHHFVDPTGSDPAGSLILENGYLYGMTRSGGANSVGTVFRIMPDGSGYANIYDFDGNANGANPMGDLVSDGTSLYGMTFQGGSNNLGIVFKTLLDGSGYVKLLDFNGSLNGKYPQGSLLLENGVLYGMTKQGGTLNMGVIFQIHPDGSGFQVVYDFPNGMPYGSLISDGTQFYGMSHDGGSDMVGSAFSIAHNGTGYQDLVEFNVQNGSFPNGSLILVATDLYGMTIGGGLNDLGTVFKYGLVPNGIASGPDDLLGAWPNPSDGRMTVATPAGSGWIRVVDVFGVCVLRAEVGDVRTAVDLRGLAKGAYCLEVWDGTGMRSGRVVLE